MTSDDFYWTVGDSYISVDIDEMPGYDDYWPLYVQSTS